MNIARSWGLFIAIIVSVFPFAAVLRAAPASAPAAQTRLQEQLDHGDAALDAGQYDDARSAYIAASQIDDTNLHAYQGAALAAHHLKEYAQAKGLLEKALTRSAAAKSNRVVNYNLALAALNSQQALRGAQALKNYLDLPATPADAPALELLWSCIYATEDAGANDEREADQIDELTKFADKYNDRVDALRPGLKLWGNEWRKPADVDQARKKLSVLEAEVSTSMRKIAEARVLVARRKAAVEDVRNRGRHTGAVSDAKRALNNAIELLEKATTHHERVSAAAQASRPPVSKDLQPLDFDETTPSITDDPTVVSPGQKGHRRKHR